jgi:hypothetical protein
MEPLRTARKSKKEKPFQAPRLHSTISYILNYLSFNALRNLISDLASSKGLVGQARQRLPGPTAPLSF